MTIYREDLDEMSREGYDCCGDCDCCSDCDCSHAMYMYAKCHPEALITATYHGGEVTLRCAECGETVACVAVAGREYARHKERTKRVLKMLRDDTGIEMTPAEFESQLSRACGRLRDGMRRLGHDIPTDDRTLLDLVREAMRRSED